MVIDLGGDDEAFALALGPPDEAGNQRIVVGGGGVNTFAVLRFTQDGVADTSFDGDGVVLTGDFGGGERVTGIAVLPDGKILATGPGFGDFVLFRLTVNGFNDWTFGNYGFVTTNIGGDDEPFSLALRPDGKILVAGRTNGDIAVARYEAFGILDDSFRGGYVVTNIREGADVARSVLAMPGDDVLVAGGSDGDVALVRYDAEGAPVPSFGNTGIVLTDVAGGDDGAAAAALLPDGRYVLAGTVDVGLGDDIAAFRHNADGTPDKQFGGSGRAATDIASPADELTGVALDGSGRIVAGGYSATGLGWDFALSRYDSAGVADPSFGVGGKVTTNLSGDDRAYAMALPEGRVILAGESNGSFAVARYQYFGNENDGMLDPSFGTGGKVVTAFDGTAAARAVAVQPDGRIVVAGFVDNVFAVARYLFDGTLDPAFGDGTGIVTTGILGGSAQAYAVAVQPDGKIVVAGDVVPSFGVGFGRSAPSLLAGSRAAVVDGDRDFALVRYLPDGTLDPEFNDGTGIVVTDGAKGPEFGRFVGKSKPPTVTLKRAMSTGPDTTWIWTWHQLARAAALTAYKDTTFMLYGAGSDPSGSAALSYILVNAFPTKVEIAGMKAGATEVVVQTVTLQCDEIIEAPK